MFFNKLKRNSVNLSLHHLWVFISIVGISKNQRYASAITPGKSKHPYNNIKLDRYKRDVVFPGKAHIRLGYKTF